MYQKLCKYTAKLLNNNMIKRSSFTGLATQNYNLHHIQILKAVV